MREKILIECVVIIFVLWNEVNLTCCLKYKNRPCEPKGPCRCDFSNGSIVDLSGLPNFDWVKLNETADIFFHPCTDAWLANDTECSSTSICLRNNDTTTTKMYRYTNLGKANEGKFSDKIEEPLTIDFRNGETSVLLTCSTEQNSKLTATQIGNHYKLELISPNSCHRHELGIENPSRLSTGSTLILIFFVLSLTYFGGGMLTLRLLRGAEGKEMIPNYEFWADLPYLVRDGILFTLSGFQASPSYDRI